MLKICLFIIFLMTTATLTHADTLTLVKNGKTTARIVLAANAGEWEKRAGADLQKYIEMMSGAKPLIAETAEGTVPAIYVGSAALKVQPNLQTALSRVAKKNPTLRADAIVVRREGNRVLLAGINDQSHYYAVSWLLQNWGCRWYLPGEIGECIPRKSILALDELDFAYAPPFEVRTFWLSFTGDKTGHEDFKARNMMNSVLVPHSHALGQYLPPSKPAVVKAEPTINVPLAEEETIDHVAAQVESMYANGEDITLSMDDGVYQSDSALDKKLRANLFDKYFLAPMLTDNFMTLYNGVARRLQQKYPHSKSKIGFLAYSNITFPPQQVLDVEKPLIAYLAPIDIDPIHGMDDPQSPSRQEYKAMMNRWAQIMDKRVVIYDYDQSMLVWRDLPNPSLQAFRQDVKHYRNAGILGFSTESRGALATTFTNMFWRAQLQWNPDANIAKMQSEFYSSFYGPAAAPMKAYWSEIERAWNDSVVTEHEYMVAPAIYTPKVMAKLQSSLERAESLVVQLSRKSNQARNEKLYLDRMAFTRAGFDVLDNYMKMVRAAASESDFRTAANFGDKGLAAQLKLAKMHPTFTVNVIEPNAYNVESGAAWWPGEVEQYRELSKLADGTRGVLLTKTPLQWAFHRDPNDSGLASGWAYAPVDLSYWNANKAKYSLTTLKDYPTTQWEVVDTDVYLQAQGIRHPDAQNYTGFGWYRTQMNLPAMQAQGNVHLMFPGLFNEAWLYVNGRLVAHREFPKLWWNSDYKFEWDVDLTGKLKPGANDIALRINVPNHFGGMFRCPFLYRLVPGQQAK